MSKLGLGFAKSYMKHPNFLSIGFNLLTSTALSTGSTLLSASLHAPVPVIAATIIAPFFLHTFISAISSIEGDEGLSGKLFYPLKRMSQLIVNGYIHIKPHHLLDEKNNQNDMDN